MTRKLTYLSIFVFALAVRLLINFHYELIPGMNGGYYPLQVRSILENGSMGFSDMPLYFYLNAAVVKVVSFITPTDIDTIILLTVKILDSLFLPLLLLPFYYLVKNLGARKKLSLFSEAIIALFVVLSSSPLMFTSDLQKNGFAMPFMVGTLGFLIGYIFNKDKKDLWWALILLILTALSHFGVFSVTLAFIIIGFIFFKGKKAFLPTFLVMVFSLAVIAVFDTDRAARLLSFGTVAFRDPILFVAPPPEMTNLLFSYILLGLGLYFLLKKEQVFNADEKKVLAALLSGMVILSFPFINADYARRLMLMLFVPQAIVLAMVWKAFSKKMKIIIPLLLVLFSIIPGFGVVKMKQPILTSQAYADLVRLKPLVEASDSSIVIARHGLEWWAGWALQSNIGNEKGVDDLLFQKYVDIFFLKQKKGQYQERPLNSQPRSRIQPPPLKQPELPLESAVKIHSSDFFDLYKWGN
jgi:hypothetical protein